MVVCFILLMIQKVLVSEPLQLFIRFSDPSCCAPTCEVWEGTTYVIGQHAFPMEKQAALAVPEEKKGMTVSWWEFAESYWMLRVDLDLKSMARPGKRPANPLMNQHFF